MNPIVSVVMPAYNGEKFIKEAVDSIVNQTISNWELIIVDDCSTDNTYAILQTYKDDRIKIQQNSVNRGISYTTNRAIDLSHGKYIALLDDDDIAPKDRLAVQVTYLEEHADIDVLGGRAIDIDENGNYLKQEKEPLHNPMLIKAYMHFVNRRFSNGTTIFRRDFIERYNLRFKEGFYGMQDFKFMADCSKVGNISSVDRLCQYKRIHKNEASFIYDEKNLQEKREAYARIIQESIDDSGFKISERNMSIILNTITYPMRQGYTSNEIKIFINILSEMIRQCYKMEADYSNEFEFACKRIIADYVLPKTDFTEIVKLVNGSIG